MLGPAVLFLLGPTAVGKSRITLALAERFGGEIVNVDAMQIYCGLDKGTAKPSQQVRRAFPHHLIDIVDAAEDYSAALYADAARPIIKDILRRKKLALISGGSMFYAKVLLEGIADLPSAQPELRAKYLKQAQDFGWDYLYNQLLRLDPQTAQRISAGDRQRILRALEIVESKGQPFSSILKESRIFAGLRSILVEYDIPLRVYGILPTDRAFLHHCILKRFHSFLDSGLVEEVRGLQQRGDLSLRNNSVRSVGYRQVWKYLEGEFGYEEMINKAAAATRQLAKRQLTWIRHWKNIIHLDASAAEKSLLRDPLLMKNRLS